jgi:hypothetical protein
MHPQTEVRLEKVKRTSRSARRLCFLLMVFVGLVMAIVVAAILAGSPSMVCGVYGMQTPCSELPPQLLMFTLALLGGLGLVLLALHRLARLFEHYARGEIFTRGSVRELRLLGYVAVAYAVLQVVLFVGALALAARGAIDPAELRIDFPIVPAVIASLVMLLSWIMDVGAEMREENELTV